MAKRKKETYGPHVALTNELLEDPTWRNFSRSAALVWIYLRKGYGGGYDTRIRLGPKNLKGVMSKRMFWYGIKELKEAGWVEVVQDEYTPSKGNLYKLKGPHGYFIFNGFKLT